MTVTANAKLPDFFVIPDSNPLELFNANPLGNVPEVTFHSYGVCPPTADKDAEYDWPAVACGSAEVVIDRLAACTVRVAEPETPLGAVAVIRAEPAASAEASPLLLTEAVEGAFEDQVKVMPVRVLPEASLAEAVNCWVWLTLI